MAWIIMGIVSLSCFIMGGVLLQGKGAMLIAGYNTMSEKEKANYDTKALCQATGTLIIVVGIALLLMQLGNQLRIGWLTWLSAILLFVLPIGFIIYSNTGNRFLKKADAKIAKDRKFTTYLVVVVTAIPLIFSGILLYQGSRPVQIIFYEENFRIEGMMGRTVSFAEIEHLELLDESMHDIGTGRRRGGFGGIGQSLRGNFDIGILFVQADSAPTIRIDRYQGRPIFISLPTGEATLDLYALIKDGLSE